MIRLLRFISNHPFNSDRKAEAILNFFKWQISSFINKYPIIYPFTEHSKLIMWNGLTGATQNMYCGLQEFNEMGFLLHFLRAEDTFVDIGANIGSYTVLASAEIGANSISIEPIPNTFKHLNNNVLVNNIKDKVILFNIGLGSRRSIEKFTATLDTKNHMAINDLYDTIDVNIDTLDNILDDRSPKLIKIDVEGFETEVLKGAINTLKNDELKAIIIELNGSGHKYGYDESIIHHELLESGFTPYYYEPLSRTLTKLTTYGIHNTIYIRDIDYVQNRLATAREFIVNNRIL